MSNKYKKYILIISLVLSFCINLNLINIDDININSNINIYINIFN